MARRTLRLPEPVDAHRDDVTALVEKLGHDPDKVLRLRIHRHEIQVDLEGPRRDIPKVTITHPIIGGES